MKNTVPFSKLFIILLLAINSILSACNRSEKQNIDSNLQNSPVLPQVTIPQDIRGVVNSIFSSNVSIETIGPVSVDDSNDTVWNEGSGSGFLYNKEQCHVWTNQHVIQEASFISVLKDNLKSPAKVIFVDPFIDFAVIKLDHCENIEEAKLADSDLVKSGVSVYAIGNPFGKNPESLSKGIVSNTNRLIDKINISLIQTDAAINQGNSGGGLFNSEGDVIAVNFALAMNSKGSGNNGVGYAIPINRYKEAYERFLRHHSPPADPFIDLELTNANEVFLGTETNVSREGVLVTGYVNDFFVNDFFSTPFKENDLITHIGSKKVISKRELKYLLWSEYEAGDDVSITLRRENEIKEIHIKLNAFDTTDSHTSPSPYEGLLGMRLEMWGPSHAKYDAYKNRINTPIITHIANLGPAHRAKIRSNQNASQLGANYRRQFIVSAETIVGAYIEGQYYPIFDLEAVDKVSEIAYSKKIPLVLVIDSWKNTQIERNSPELFQKVKRGYFTVYPRPYTELESTTKP
ncbi:MAG: trypsin-like peptidase domain-containing protein [Bdellovibrionales bacterium]|nr:trypsin-like peptidase domain-containing protein [Bdellovibrionales bacterium]